MSKTVKVTYNADTLQTTITVDGQPFDTSRIDGKEIEDWAYPFMIRKIKWNGFYDEMVEALGDEKEFNLIFDGSDEALAELKEAWEDAPVTVVSEESCENVVVIEYDENALTTNITVNGQPFDTSRINGKEIEDWVYPFMIRKVKWDGIFEELSKAVHSQEYTIKFSGSNKAMKILMEECPDSVSVIENNVSSLNKNESNISAPKKSDFDKMSISELLKYIEDFNWADSLVKSEINHIVDIIDKYAKHGNYDAQYQLAKWYSYNKIGIEENDTIANEWYLKAINGYEISNNNSHQIQYRVADAYEYGRGVEQNEDKAIEWHKKAAKQGNADSCFSLYTLLDDIKWLRKSAELGFNSYYLLGSCFVDEEDNDEAFKWFKIGADKNDSFCMKEVGLYYYHGISVNQNFNEAVKWFTKAAENGNMFAQDSLGDCYYFGHGVQQSYKKAVEWFEKSAEQGVHTAMDRLGDCYYWGYGVEEDNDKAVEWYMKAAKAGNPKSQQFIGALYYNGIYFERDYNEAVKWLSKSADKNDKYSQYFLGECYYLGNGVSQNYAKAVELYKKAAEQGEDRAQDSLGDCYYFGHGVQQNYEKAVEWYTEAANQGNVSAMYDLAICCYYGNGVETDYQQAAELFENAANEGFVESMNLLGDCYYEGKGVPQNYSKAVSLYEKALNNNSPQAYYNLGSCYRWGNGVRKDKEKAKELFKKGIELGSQNCKEAYEEMLKNADRIETAKKIGGKILSVLGEAGNAYAQAYYSDGDE